jgi:C1A family cysteine protease
MQQQQKRRTGFGTGFLVAACWMVAGLASAQERPLDTPAGGTDRFLSASGEVLGTGARRPTAQQRAWGEAHLQNTLAVPLNPLGLERVNSVRKARRQPLLRVATQPSTGAVAKDASPVPSVSSSDAPVALAADLPTGVDNSTLKFFPPIRNQGALGSCAQFAAVYYTLTHMTAMARDWDAKNGGDQVRFSPKWTYNMLNGGNDQGSWHYDAYLIAQQHGAATWAEFPYDTDYRSWCLNPAVWRNAINVRADQAGRVTALRTDAGLTQLKSLLVNGYVLNFATFVGSWKWLNAGNDPATSADNTLAGKSVAYKVSGTSGSHTMTVVGYNDDIWVDINNDGLVTANEKGALRIANSWGTTWKEAGFTWLSYDALCQVNPSYPYEGAFWYDEATWVTARPSYTPRLIAEFTVKQGNRSQMQVLLGVSGQHATAPALTWNSEYTLSFAGGPWAFDGTTTAVEGTFCFDLSDLAAGQTGEVFCYLGIRDCLAGQVTTLTSARLMNGATGRETASAGGEQVIDAAQVFFALGSESAVAIPPPVSAFKVQAMNMSSEGMTLMWASVPGVVYGIQHAVSPAGPWTLIKTVPASETGSSTTTVAPVDPGATSGFFKIVGQS